MQKRKVAGDSQFGLTEGKWRLTTLIDFYDEMNNSGDKRAVDVVYLDLIKDSAWSPIAGFS